MRIQVSSTQTIILNASIEAVYAALADVEDSGLLMPGVVKVERLSADRYRWTLEERNVLGIPFAGQYLTQYEFSPAQSISWTTAEGNIDSSGSFQLSELTNGTLVEASIENAVELPLPPLLESAMQLFVKKQVEKGTLAMLQGVASKLSKATEV